MPFKFEEVLGDFAAKAGKLMDEGVEAYHEASTHHIKVVGSEGRTVFHVTAPVEPVKELVKKVGDKFQKLDAAVTGAVDHACESVSGFVQTVSGLRLEVTPMEKPAQVPPASQPKDGGIDTTLL